MPALEAYRLSEHLVDVPLQPGEGGSDAALWSSRNTSIRCRLTRLSPKLTPSWKYSSSGASAPWSGKGGWRG